MQRCKCGYGDVSMDYRVAINNAANMDYRVAIKNVAES